MADDINSRDQNHVTTLSGVTDNVAQEIRELLVDPSTGRLLVSALVTSGAITSLNGLTASVQTFADVDDTNVTLAIASATSTHTFTMGWTGLLSVPRGGTGVGSFTAYSVILGGTTSTGALQDVGALGTSGEVLTSNGAGAAPTWQAAAAPATAHPFGLIYLGL